MSITEPDLLQRDPTRVLMRQVFGAIAQYEKAMIAAKLRGARDRVKDKVVLRNVVVKCLAIHGNSEHNILCHEDVMASSLEAKQRGTKTESTNDVTKLLVTKEVK